MTPDGCTRVIRCAKGRGVRAAYHRFLSSQAADLRSAKGGCLSGYQKPYSLQGRPQSPRGVTDPIRALEERVA